MTKNQRIGKSKILEDGTLVLVSFKGDRYLKFPLVSTGLGIIFIIWPLLEILKAGTMQKDVVWFSVVVLITAVIVLRMYLELYKKVILSEDGAIIKIGKYEKFFMWHEFYEKSIIRPKKLYHYPEVVFSVNYMNCRMKMFTAADFSALRRPFTSFSLVLESDYKFESRSEWEGFGCRFSEYQFMQKMQEWDIKLKERQSDYSARISPDLR